MADDIKNHDEEIKVLLAALLWIRNHHDNVMFNETARLRRKVVARIDRVLMDHKPICINDLREFRRRYPQEGFDE